MLAENEGIWLSKREALGVQIFCYVGSMLIGVIVFLAARRDLDDAVAMGLAFFAAGLTGFFPLKIQKALHGGSLSAGRFLIASVVGAIVAGGVRFLIRGW